MSIKATSYQSSSKLYTGHQYVNRTTKQFWWMWMLALSVILVVFLLTADRGPYLHSDEFVILDLGRIILDPTTKWSIAWLADLEQPVYLISYLGNVIQELSFIYGGQYGPRISALIGALAAATALTGWLLARGTSQWASFFLGLVFLLDPLFVHSYTIGRLDGWAMALCLSSCWLLRYNYLYTVRTEAISARLSLAGALAVTAFFIWPSAIFLYPLIGIELFNILSQISLQKNIKMKALRSVLFFVAGGGLAMLFLLLPIVPQLSAQLSNAVASYKANTHAGASGNSIDFFQNSIELMRILKFSPFVVLIAIIGTVKERNVLLTAAIGVVIALIVFTLVYINRVLYLIPYLIACISYLYRQANNHFSIKLLNVGSIVILLFWSVGLSLGARTFLAFDAQANRNRNLVNQAALTLVGPGNHRVYVPYDMYYAGRKLGWQMYRAYLAHNNPLTFNVLKKILPHVDYVIMIQYQVTEEVEQGLLSEGWYDEGVLDVYSEPAELFNGVTTNEVRVRNLFSIFSKPYGPYRLFVRENKSL